MVALKKARIHNYYDKEVVGVLKKELGLANVMQVPRLTRIVLNMGLGEAIGAPKALESGAESLTLITGQKAVVTKARKSIATFKLREGMPIGCTVTLRKQRMWEFFDRFVNIALPRVRDFRGVKTNFDGSGNCTIGVREQIIFPEVEYDKVDKIRGLNVTFVTNAKGDKEGKALLTHLGVPFRKSSEG